MPDLIRADYKSVTSISDTFREQAQQVRGIYNSLTTTCITRLKHERGWVGNNANAFYRDIEEDILPSVQRLAEVLTEAASVMLQIKAIMRQAEEEAAAHLQPDNPDEPSPTQPAWMDELLHTTSYRDIIDPELLGGYTADTTQPTTANETTAQLTFADLQAWERLWVWQRTMSVLQGVGQEQNLDLSLIFGNAETPDWFQSVAFVSASFDTQSIPLFQIGEEEDEEHGIRDYPFIPTSLFAETPFGTVLIPYLLPRSDAVDDMLNELTEEERMLLTVGVSYFFPTAGAVLDGVATATDALDAAQEGDSEGARNILLLGALGFLLGETPLPEAVVNRIGRVLDNLEGIAHSAVTVVNNLRTILPRVANADDLTRIFTLLGDSEIENLARSTGLADTLNAYDNWARAIERTTDWNDTMSALWLDANGWQRAVNTQGQLTDFWRPGGSTLASVSQISVYRSTFTDWINRMSHEGLEAHIGITDEVLNSLQSHERKIAEYLNNQGIHVLSLPEIAQGVPGYVPGVRSPDAVIFRDGTEFVADFKTLEAGSNVDTLRSVIQDLGQSGNLIIDVRTAGIPLTEVDQTAQLWRRVANLPHVRNSMGEITIIGNGFEIRATMDSNGWITVQQIIS